MLLKCKVKFRSQYLSHIIPILDGSYSFSFRLDKVRVVHNLIGLVWITWCTCCLVHEKGDISQNDHMWPLQL